MMDTISRREHVPQARPLPPRPSSRVTAEGLPVIRQLISEGLYVNVTLLFGISRYRQVTEAYLAGLEARAAQVKPVRTMASVASLFVSRIDVLLDSMLAKRIAEDSADADTARTLQGQVASAKSAYQDYKEIFGSERFQSLAHQGASTQSLL